MTALAEHATGTREIHADALIELAGQVAQDTDLFDAPRVRHLVEALAHPSLTAEQRDEAFEDLVDQVDRLDGVETGNIHWSDIEPELTCIDRDAEAYKIQRQIVGDAVAYLLDGK